MELKIYDDIKLNTELTELAEKGIHNGCSGIILDIKADVCFVRFRNFKNYGDYACVNVNKKYLDFDCHVDKKYIPNWERFKASKKFKREFNVNPFNEFDWVEILVEKEEYAKEGLHKGMKANVLFNYAVDDMLPVMFSGEDGYDVEVSVNIKDMKSAE